MTRVKVIAQQKYNSIVMYFPTALLAGMMMDDLIVATDGNISFTIEVEEIEEKEDTADVGEAAENTDED